MAYFNHAFCKAFLVDSFASASTKTKDFGPGVVELVQDWASVEASAGNALAVGKLFYFVQGSFQTNDFIGNNPGHGGYTESVKSKGINARYISRLWSSDCKTATQSTARLSVDSTCAPCDTNLMVRLDVKGSPALRFLNRNAYAVGDSAGDAALNGGPLPGVCCIDGQNYLDPAVALAASMQMVLADPITAPFVIEGNNVTDITLGAVNGTGYTDAQDVPTTGGSGTGLTVDITTSTGNVTAVVVNNPGKDYVEGDVITIVQGSGASDDETATLTVTQAGIVVNTTAGGYEVLTIKEVLDGTYTPSTDPVGEGVSAEVNIIGAYVDTKFGNSSFDTRDFYEKEPVQLQLSAIDDSGNPCENCGVASSTPGTMQETSGECVLREIILTERYMQNPFNQGAADSQRIREIEGSEKIVNAVDRNALYKTYYIQHSIPRLSNPSGVFDNDQYVYKIFVKCSDTANIAAMDALMDEIVTVAAASGNPITFESDIDA